MKTDRELLELAAKAAGLLVNWEPAHGCYWISLGQGIPVDVWNPIDIDSDAFRLAMRLGVEILPDLEVGEISTAYSYVENGKLVGNNTYEEFHDHHGDAMSAARRAIVRAAAAIGESMP